MHLLLRTIEVFSAMQGKIIVTLLLGTFPYITLPLYLDYFLSTRLPEPYKYFFSDYSPLLISAWYALPFIGLGIYWLLKKRRSQAPATDESS